MPESAQTPEVRADMFLFDVGNHGAECPRLVVHSEHCMALSTLAFLQDMRANRGWLKNGTTIESILPQCMLMFAPKTW